MTCLEHYLSGDIGQKMRAKFPTHEEVKTKMTAGPKVEK